MTPLRHKLFLVVFSLCSSTASLQAQRHPIDVGADYTYVRSNILPGCSCFSLNGGGAQLQAGLTPHLAAVADFAATESGNITPDRYQLTLLTYTFGLRYMPLRAGRLSPFGEVLVGGGHTFGSLSPARSGVGGSSNAVAFQTGGGLSLQVRNHIRVVPIQADYLLSNFDNGQQNVQNYLRLSAGVVFRLKR